MELPFNSNNLLGRVIGHDFPRKGVFQPPPPSIRRNPAHAQAFFSGSPTKKYHFPLVSGGYFTPVRLARPAHRTTAKKNA